MSVAKFGDQYGPYRSDWGRKEKKFFDSEPNNFRELYTANEWLEVQEAFTEGWVAVEWNTGERITREEHEAARQRYYDLTGTAESSFDWEYFREYLHSIGS